MKVLFLTPLPEDCASTRQRIHKYIPIFKKEGIKCKVYPAISAKHYRHWHTWYGSKSFLNSLMYILYETFSRLRHIFTSFRFDIVYVQKVLTSTSLRGMDRLLFLLNKKVIYDFDDCTYVQPYTQFPSRFTFLQDYGQVNKIIKKSKAVIAGNNFLKEYAIKLNNFVKVVPTSMDTEWYHVKKHPEHSSLATIGWSGSNGTNHYLNYLPDVLNAIGKKYNYVNFLIISNSTVNIRLDEFKDIKIEFCTWKLESLVQDLHKIDIGIMPLVYDSWSPGKCGGKILQYMACGIPVVCTPIGANCHIVSEGVNGFFASTDEEWIEKLSRLIEDAGLRAKIGYEGRRTVEESYSNMANAPKLMQVFRRVCGERIS